MLPHPIAKTSALPHYFWCKFLFFFKTHLKTVLNRKTKNICLYKNRSMIAHSFNIFLLNSFLKHLKHFLNAFKRFPDKKIKSPWSENFPQNQSDFFDTSFFVHFYFSAGFNLKNSVFSALFAPFYLIPAFSIVLNLFCISLVNLHIAYIVIT